MGEYSIDEFNLKRLLGSENGRPGSTTKSSERHAGSGDADSSRGALLPNTTSLDELDPISTATGEASDSPMKTTGYATKGPEVGLLPTDQIDLLVPFPPTLPSQYKALVLQIETTKHPNYPFILRRVYEAGHLKSFLQYLDRRSEARDAEIERVCAEHTSTLTEAAKDLMSVSRGVEELRANLHADRKISGKQMGEISEAAKQAAACNNALINTALLIERISILKPVIKTVGEAQVCIENGQLVKALRKLHDAWERTRKLPHHIRLVKSLADNIPFMKNQLIMEAKRGVTTALESARNANLKAGFLTLKNVCEVNEMFIEPYVVEKGKFLDSTYADEIKFLADSKWSIDTAVDLQPLLVFRHVMLTFEPDDLNEEALKNYCENYMTQRRHQISQMVQPPNHMHSVDHFRQYIQDVIGIFSLELYIDNAVSGLTTESFFSELWNDTAAGVASALSSNFIFMTDEESCAQIKDLMNLFAVALNVLHCDSTRIHGVLEDMRDHYGEILLRKLVAQMNQVLDVDNFVAVTVVDEAEQEQILHDFPFTLDTAGDGAEFPKNFPFSASVPKFYSLIQNYIATYVNFSRDLKLSQAEVEEKVRMSTNTVLSRNLRGCVCGKVEKGALTVDQLVQAYANCTYLEYSCQYLEEYIADLLKSRTTGSATSTVSVISGATSTLTPRLESESLFKDIRSQIEQQIYTSLMNSIEEMVGRFDSAAAPDTTDKPSVLSTRLVRYLEVVFGSIGKMPYSVCQTAWMTACKHIANQLQETFIHKSSMITIEGVQQLKNDLSFYEGFLVKQNDNADPSTLLLAFSDLRQSTDLLLLWDWNTYFHEYAKKDAKYNRVQPQIALLILEKMKESDRKKFSVFQNLRKNERDKKKLLDTITTQLKDLINETAPR